MVVAVLYLAKGVLVPLTLAVLLSFLLSPVCDWLERLRLSRIPAVLLTAILGFAVLGLAAWIAVVQMTALAPKMPEYQANLQAKLHAVNDYSIAALRKLTRTAEDAGENLPQAQQAKPPQGTDERPYSVHILSEPVSPLQLLGRHLRHPGRGLGHGRHRRDSRGFLSRPARGPARSLHPAGGKRSSHRDHADAGRRCHAGQPIPLDAVSDQCQFRPCGRHRAVPDRSAQRRPVGHPDRSLEVRSLHRHLDCRSGADRPGHGHLDGLAGAILTLGLFAALELLCGNVVEPWLYGRGTGVSGVAVLVAAVFWTWLWGIVGLLLATPLTVCLLVIGKHVPQLSFLHILLGNEPVFEPKRQVYQRLLAGDQEEATELVDDDLQNKPLVDLYDTLLIPALALAETDWHRGELDEGRHKFILQSLKEMINEKAEDQPEVPVKEGIEEGSPLRPCILCLPARDEADEIAGMMLAQLLATGECLVQSVAFTVAAGEVTDLLQNRTPAVVCISATPPAAVMHARHLCKLVRGRFPEVPVVVGLWDARGDLSKVKTRIGEGRHNACCHDVGRGARTGPPADPTALAAARERRAPERCNGHGCASLKNSEERQESYCLCPFTAYNVSGGGRATQARLRQELIQCRRMTR